MHLDLEFRVINEPIIFYKKNSIRMSSHKSIGDKFLQETPPPQLLYG